MKEDGLEDVENLYTENLKETAHNVKYAAALNNTETDTNAPENIVLYDACEDLDENTNEQTLTTSRYI